MKWTQNDTLQFVKLYRDHECLWNTTSTNYRNKYKRQHAIDAIMQAMGRDGFGAVEIKQKIKNLRSTYNQEIQKIKNSSTSGCSPEEVYKPAVIWFDDMDQIMKGLKGETETQSNLDPPTDQELEDDEEVEQEDPADELETAAKEEKTPHRRTSPAQSQTLMRQSVQGTHRTSTNVEKPKGTKRRIHDLSQAVNKLRTVSQIPSQPETRMRENEAFGYYVALALAQLTPKQAIMAQNEIQNTLTRYRLGMVPIPSPGNYKSIIERKTPPSYTSSPFTPSDSLLPSTYNDLCTTESNESNQSSYDIKPDQSYSQRQERRTFQDLLSESWQTTDGSHN